MFLLKLFHQSNPTRQVESRTLDKGELAVGRDPDAGWRIEDPERQISRQHCIFAVSGDQILVKDTSSNGISLARSRDRLPKDVFVPLQLGDTVQIGRHIISVEALPGRAAVDRPFDRFDDRVAPASASPFTPQGDSSLGRGLSRPAPVDPFGSALKSSPLDRDGFQDDERRRDGPRGFSNSGEDAWLQRERGQAGDWDAQRQQPKAHDALIGAPQDWIDPPRAAPPDAGFGFDAPFRRPILSAEPVRREALLIPSDWDLNTPSGPAPAAPPPADRRATAPNDASAFAAPPRGSTETFPARSEPTFAERADRSGASVAPPPSYPASPPPDPVRRLPMEPPPFQPPPPQAPPPAPPPFIPSYGPPPPSLQPPGPPPAAILATAPPPPTPAAPAPVPARNPAVARTGEADLLAAFCAGAGLEPREFDGEDPSAVLERAGAVYRQMVLGLADLVSERTSLKNEYRMVRTTVAPEGNNPFKWAPPRRVGVDLLRSSNQGFMHGPQAVREACEDLKKHLLCLLAGMRASVGATFKALEPALIEAQVKDPSFALKRNRSASAWEAYRRIYAEFRQAADDNPDSQINREFRAAYEQQLRELDGLRSKE